MTNYRRLRQAGATYFFTLCLEARGTTTLVDHIDDLRAAWTTTLRELPVTCPAVVVMPDHLHAIWTEPTDRALYSERWRRIKARFSHRIGGDFHPGASKIARRERGLWQRRFWEHAIRDEGGFVAAMEYCQTNPVKHSLVTDPADWPFSSFTRRMGNIAHPTPLQPPQ